MPPLYAAGEQVRLTIRATAGNYRDPPALAPYWRALGIDVVEEIIPGNLTLDNEYRAKFSSVETSAQGFGDRIFPSFDSRLKPTAQNRYAA